jgi:hypothetical protein
LVAAVKRLLVSGAWLLAACATPPASPSAFEPSIGHHQPTPNAATAPDEDANAAQPDHASDDEIDGSAAISPTVEDEALCRHIVKLVQSESQDRASAEQTAELIVSCAFALAHDRQRLGTEEFDRRAACLLDATAAADFAACAPASAP